MTDRELAESMKDFAHDNGLRRLTAVKSTGRDTWTTIIVRHASVYSESPDGWDVETTRGEI